MIIDLENRNLSRKTCSSSTRVKEPRQCKAVKVTCLTSKRAVKLDNEIYEEKIVLVDEALLKM